MADGRVSLNCLTMMWHKKRVKKKKRFAALKICKHTIPSVADCCSAGCLRIARLRVRLSEAGPRLLDSVVSRGFKEEASLILARRTHNFHPKRQNSLRKASPRPTFAESSCKWVTLRASLLPAVIEQLVQLLAFTASERDTLCTREEAAKAIGFPPESSWMMFSFKRLSFWAVFRDCFPSTENSPIPIAHFECHLPMFTCNFTCKTFRLPTRETVENFRPPFIDRGNRNNNKLRFLSIITMCVYAHNENGRGSRLRRGRAACGRTSCDNFEPLPASHAFMGPRVARDDRLRSASSLRLDTERRGTRSGKLGIILVHTRPSNK